MKAKEHVTTMHELSLAINLVEIAEAAVKRHSVARVEAVHLRLGIFSGVVADSLLFAYDIATEGTLLAGSSLIVEEVPLVIYCPQCQLERELDNLQSLLCPVCGTASNEIRRGKEIEIAYLEVADEPSIT
jgi:hydrogenase nickel incorporation protein HypA/HybF